MESSIVWQLKLLVWDFFATLTWSNSEMGSYRSRQNNVTQWLGKWAEREGLHLHDLAYVIRWERGELNSRPHAHLLITRFPLECISLDTCYRQQAIWRKFHGLADVRLFSPSLGADTYITKGEGWSIVGANRYEVGKFSAADHVYVSPQARMEFLRKRAFGSQTRLRLVS